MAQHAMRLMTAFLPIGSGCGQGSFVMGLANRNLETARITAAPSGVWMAQIARNLMDVVIGFLSDHRYLICDRYPLYTRAFHVS